MISTKTFLVALLILLAWIIGTTVVPWTSNSDVSISGPIVLEEVMCRTKDGHEVVADVIAHIDFERFIKESYLEGVGVSLIHSMGRRQGIKALHNIMTEYTAEEWLKGDRPEMLQVWLGFFPFVESMYFTKLTIDTLHFEREAIRPIMPLPHIRLGVEDTLSHIPAQEE